MLISIFTLSSFHPDLSRKNILRLHSQLNIVRNFLRAPEDAINPACLASVVVAWRDERIEDNIFDYADGFLYSSFLSGLTTLNDRPTSANRCFNIVVYIYLLLLVNLEAPLL